jgi:hypothetical protein
MLRRLQQILDGALGARGRCRIFVSYRRRGEGAGYAGRLADRLVREFGDEQCFRDVDDIETGTDFVDAISKAVGSCQALVVVVAPDWLNTTDANGRRRLDDPRDFVRIEIAAALERDTRVVPVLVGGAVMPAPEQLPPALEGFARRQAHELSDSRWEYDVDQLVTAIERIGVKRATKQRRQTPAMVWRVAAATGAAGIAIWAAVALAISNLQTDQIEQKLATLAAQSTTQSTTQPTAASVIDPLAIFDDAAGSSTLGPEAGTSYETQPASYEPEPDVSYTQRAAIDAVEAERAAILDAMRRANEAERAALHHLDTSVLADAFTGTAHQAEVAAVQELVTVGIHAVNSLHEQRIVSIALSDDGNVASVEAIETWSSELRQNGTGLCLARSPLHEVPQTVQLVRSGGGWIVAAVEIRAAGPDPIPCG